MIFLDWDKFAEIDYLMPETRVDSNAQEVIASKPGRSRQDYRSRLHHSQEGDITTSANRGWGPTGKSTGRGDALRMCRMGSR